MRIRLGPRGALRALLAAPLGLLPSCITSYVLYAPPRQVEVRTVGVLAGTVTPASAPQIYVPADLVPEPWRAANPDPAQQAWLRLQPEPYAAEQVATCIAAAAKAPTGAPPIYAVRLLPTDSPGAMRAWLHGASAGADEEPALDTYCRAEWSPGPPADAIAFAAAVGAATMEQPSTWWRWCLVPFTGAADVVLFPFELAFGALMPKC